MSYDNITYELQGYHAWITINRPDTLNALDVKTLGELDEAFTHAEDDDGVRVIILTGAGDRAFVAGGDVADLESRDGLAHYQEFAEMIHRLFRRIELCDKPTIAAVNGWALGGGTEIILATDIRVVAEEARLGVPEITLGLFPGAGGTQRLLRQLPPCRAREMMFTGEQITAAEALGYGLVNHMFPRKELRARVTELAAKISSKSPLSLKLLKRSMIHGGDMPMAAALQYEQAMVGLLLDSKDAHEGCRAFLEKRAPDFHGR
ncbi:MAG: enoyl-CoA hydratase/isomerase family protein [Pseudomonadota bacterium]|nr:enoyl-CoA hydratase/isomerase family protein [Pseudomonadota bacterium]